jgi:hypothetical protein
LVEFHVSIDALPEIGEQCRVAIGLSDGSLCADSAADNGGHLQ